MLGTKFSGTVIKGDQVGRTLGFPTANLDTKNHGLMKTGLYCGYANVEEKKYQAVLCVNWKNIVEVHILDFDQEIYGKTIDVDVTEFIRTMKRIDDMEKLKNVTSMDIKLAQEILAQ